MSSLIFYTDETQALIATDTLAVSNDGNPAFFTTKAFIVPHLRMIMAGTGVNGLLSQWFSQINNGMLVRGIDHLDYHSTSCLNDLWLEMRKKLSIPDNITTTIYHFGFSEEDTTIHSYVYRSTNNFESEPIQYGIGVKPECTVPENYELPICIPNMMLEQRYLQSMKPTNERLCIGGEIHITHLTKDICNSYCLYKFKDFESDESEMYSNFNNKI